MGSSNMLDVMAITWHKEGEQLSLLLEYARQCARVTSDSLWLRVIITIWGKKLPRKLWVTVTHSNWRVTAFEVNLSLILWWWLMIGLQHVLCLWRSLCVCWYFYVHIKGRDCNVTSRNVDERTNKQIQICLDCYYWLFPACPYQDLPILLL